MLINEFESTKPIKIPLRMRLLASAFLSLSVLAPSTLADTFISEIHYDNASTDINEAIEISSYLATDLSTWSVVLYNGSNGSVYHTIQLPESVVVDASCGAAGGTVVINFPSNGIQNGAPDGIALVNGSTVEAFISYEGSFEATAGPAAGLTSVDIGVSETGSTLATESLQLVNGTWSTPTQSTFGVCTTEVDGAPTPTPTVTPTPTAALSISEFHYDNAGADEGEAIELQGPAGAAVDGWQVVLYNGSNNSSYLTRNLNGVLIAADGCEQGSFVETLSGIQNGSPDAIALVDPNGMVQEFISYEGALTAIGGPADGLTSVDVLVAETSSTSIGQSLQNINGVWQGPSANTFGSCNAPQSGGVVTLIHDIQGSGDSVTNQAVFTVEAIVIGDFQSSDQLSGFFIQEEDADADSNNATSEGIFVYCADCPVDVSVGDQVRVTGLANEFFDMSQITATYASDIQVLATEQTLPTAATVDLPVVTTAADVATATNDVNAYYESVEGMLVTIPAELSISEYFQLARFGHIVLSAGGRPKQFTDANAPSADGFTAHQIDLLTRRIILDDDNDVQNSALFSNTHVFHPTPGFAVDNYFRGGDKIKDLTGVLHWSWAGSSGTNAWRIRPVADAFSYNFESVNPRANEPRDVGGDLKVASFNVLNYFTTIDLGPAACGPDQNIGCRGAHSPEELLRQTQKIVSAICAIDADIVGLMELQNPHADMSEPPITALVNAINEVCSGYAAIETGPIGGDAITVGVIYKPETVTPAGTTAILDDASFTDPNSTGQDKNRPAIAQSFAYLPSNDMITIAVNHLKSKGSSCGAGDDDTVMGQGNCNLTRTLASQAQAEWLATNPTGVNNNEYVLIIGDLNAYRNEDPISALIDAGYTDMNDFFNGEDAYGFVFDGQLGYLDHALANEALVPLITDVTDWHINADEVNLLDYNDPIQDAGEGSFEAKPSTSSFFSENAFRSSDHDPLIIGIDFPERFECNGLAATIYVNDGIIVGGLHDGQPFSGKLFGTKGDDVILGTDNADRIYAFGGNDTVCGEGGNDYIQGGRGMDVLFGGAGDDLIRGGKHDDIIDGGDGFDKAKGNRGKDTCKAEIVRNCEVN